MTSSTRASIIYNAPPFSAFGISTSGPAPSQFRQLSASAQPWRRCGRRVALCCGVRVSPGTAWGSAGGAVSAGRERRGTEGRCRAVGREALLWARLALGQNGVCGLGAGLWLKVGCGPCGAEVVLRAWSQVLVPRPSLEVFKARLDGALGSLG